MDLNMFDWTFDTPDNLSYPHLKSTFNVYWQFDCIFSMHVSTICSKLGQRDISIFCHSMTHEYKHFSFYYDSPSVNVKYEAPNSHEKLINASTSRDKHLLLMTLSWFLNSFTVVASMCLLLLKLIQMVL